MFSSPLRRDVTSGTLYLVLFSRITSEKLCCFAKALSACAIRFALVVDVFALSIQRL